VYADSGRSSTFPRGHCFTAMSTPTTAMSPSGCDVVDCGQYEDRSPHIDSVHSRSASSSSSGIGSMGLYENIPAGTSLRPAPAVPVQKCKYRFGHCKFVSL